MAKQQRSVTVTPRTLEVIAELSLKWLNKGGLAIPQVTETEVEQLFASAIDAHIKLCGYDLPVAMEPLPVKKPRRKRAKPSPAIPEALADDEARGFHTAESAAQAEQDAAPVAAPEIPGLEPDDFDFTDATVEGESDVEAEQP